MANRLSMADIYTIVTLHTSGHSQKAPNRATVGLTEQGRTSSRSGPASGCEPFRAQILAKLEQNPEAVRIHQDLVADHQEQRPATTAYGGLSPA